MVAKKPIRVSQLNAYLARLIAADSVLSSVTVVGEISNLKLHSSGHVYFSLKDETSRLDCFLPAGIYMGLNFDLKDGSEIIADGYVNVYEKGGRYSLTIRHLTEAGQGDLAQAFEQLKQKLAEKGYFDESRKKPLPTFPKKIAIVTSATGAAVADMIKIISARNSVVDILVFPSLVQGEGAAEMIASQIRRINEDYSDIDVMIVGRGGGSAEDLWAFNEEAVADAIFFSDIPVISAVGHETDFTISDFVSDRRAETPTAAAALAAPDTTELKDDLDMLLGQLKSSMTGLFTNLELKVRANNISALIGRLKSGVSERKTHAEFLLAGMKNTVYSKYERNNFRVKAAVEKLEALDPKRVLSRGYAIIENDDKKAISSASALTAGQKIRAKFSDGEAVAEIKEVWIDGKR